MSNNAIKSRAQGLLQANMPAEAKTLYAQVCKADPSDVEAWHMLSAVNGMLGLFEESEYCARKVIKLNSSAVPAYNNLGAALLEQGKFSEAEAVLKKALKLDRNNPETLNSLGNIYLRKEQYDRARECYNKSIKIKPGDAKAHNNLANVYLYLKMPDEALKCLRTALKINPSYPDALLNYAKTLQELGQTRQALAEYNKALQLQPGNKDALFGIGNLQRESGNLDVAIQCFESIIRVDPRYTDAHVGLGITYQELRKPEQAVRALTRAIDIDGERADIHHYLGLSYKEAGDLPGAARYFERALEIAPDFVQASHMLASLGFAPVPDKADPRYVAALFDDYSDHFEEHLVSELEYRVPEILGDMLVPVLGDASGQYDILDMGCGTGLCAPIFSPWSKTLVGVDLSAKMIACSRALDLYTDLVLGDLLEPLEKCSACYDLILATDVFIYLGKLDYIFQACSAALKDGGLLAFSIESIGDDRDYILHAESRYAQSRAYIRRIAEQAGLSEQAARNVVIRKGKGKGDGVPVEGAVFVFRK